MGICSELLIERVAREEDVQTCSCPTSLSSLSFMEREEITLKFRASVVLIGEDDFARSVWKGAAGTCKDQQ